MKNGKICDLGCNAEKVDAEIHSYHKHDVNKTQNVGPVCPMAVTTFKRMLW